MQTNEYKHYQYSYKGIKLDPYRILSVYGVTCPAMQHAIKKLLRAGNSVKDLEQDIKEVIDTLKRKLEMIEEDKGLVLKEDEGLVLKQEEDRCEKDYEDNNALGTAYTETHGI